MTRRGLLIAAAAATLIAPSDAQAAIDPPQARVAPGAVAKFAGAIDTFGQVGWVDVAQGTAGGMNGSCVEPMCQQGTLEVSGGSAGKLHVVVGVVRDMNNVSIEVEKPDGTVVYLGSGYFTVNTERHVVIDRPADGTYTVRVAGEGATATNGKGDFAGGAWLELPGGTSSSGDRALDEIACPLLRTYPHPATKEDLRARQWGLEQIKAPTAWKRGFTGKGVKLAVIDTGIDFEHPEFAGRVLPDGRDTTPTESAECGPGPHDDHGHGTAVASLAAGADDGSGITGVAPEAEILPVKVVISEGFAHIEWLIAGLRHAIDAKVDVINLSLGGDELTPIIYGQPDQDPHMLAPLIKEAWDKGIVVVAAGGNSHEPQCLLPARSPHALCVAGTDRDGLPSDFSALPNGDGVGNGVRAPSGADAKSEANGCAEYVVHAWWPRSGGNCETGSPAYGMGFGTSYGTPHVAGLAVLLKQAGLTNGQIVERIRMTASNKGASDPVMGYGLIDADAATEGLKPLPPGQVGKPNPQPHKPSRPRTARKPSAPCRAARKASRHATKRAAAAKRAVRREATRARKRTLARRLRARDRAIRAVAKRCR